ncbi:hypothetical protein Pflav_047250 [Phytohabitans flavus]|uniref:Uncharacterized protein n=1 Tax=Phytohabitans flavus TaxID=1076124 RepID=A0A6F8XWV8_9ACTN|nr:hypothetical protein Pflav_047250 [Phytohabitans flavus]
MLLAPAVEGMAGLAGDVEDDPEPAGVHEVVGQSPAEQVVVVTGDQPPERVGHPPRPARDVGLDQAREAFVDTVGGAVVCDGGDRPAQAVEVGDGRGRGVARGLGGGGLFERSERPARAAVVPRRQVLVGVQAAGEAGHVGVGGGIEQDGVVAVPGLLPPRVEGRLDPGVVGSEGGDDPSERIAAGDAAHAGGPGELQPVRSGEERLVAADRLPLVVADGPSGAGPPDRDGGSVRGERAGRDAGLVLHRPAQAVAVHQLVLDPAGLPRSQVPDVDLAGHGVRHRSLGRVGVTASPVREDVVDHPGGGRAEQRLRGAERVGQVRGDLGVGQVGGEAVQAVAGLLPGLAQDGGADHHAQGVEGRRDPVAVGVGDQPWL